MGKEGRVEGEGERREGVEGEGERREGVKWLVSRDFQQFFWREILCVSA